MEYILISLVSLTASIATLFSGFGLGTILTPVFALFFPIEIAIGMTAIVHFSNNGLKLILFIKQIHWNTAIKFGLISVPAAFAGAYLLSLLSSSSHIISYTIGNNSFQITSIKIIIAFLLLFFSIIELVPRFSNIQFNSKYLTLGGFLSGFFGGLSGNQGAFRSAFLLSVGLSKEAFIATGVIIACIVDVTRLSLYSKSTFTHINEGSIYIILVAILSAFIGVFIGTKLIKKITISIIQKIVALFLIVFSILLGIGIL